MKFEQVKKHVSSLDFAEVRTDDPAYFEAVILRDRLPELSEKLEKLFGEAAFPSESGLTLLMEQSVQEFGGVREGQTLYFWGNDRNCIFAMLWPWQDQQHVTLKLVQK